jgi:hypothetical protein
VSVTVCDTDVNRDCQQPNSKPGEALWGGSNGVVVTLVCSMYDVCIIIIINPVLYTHRKSTSQQFHRKSIKS